MNARADYHREYYQRHKDKYQAKSFNWFKSLSLEEREERKRKNREYVKRQRVELLAAYGNRCNCCNETTEEFLTLDHIFNDGAEHRKNQVGGSRVYADLKKKGYPKDRYQLLCMNCNFAKRMGDCPHQKRKLQ